MNRIEFETTIAFILGTLETIPRSQWGEIGVKLRLMEWDSRLGEPPRGWDKMPGFNRGLRRLTHRYEERLIYVDRINKFIGDRMPPLRVTRSLLDAIERSR